MIITCIDEPASNEKLLQQLIGQQEEITRLLSLMAQPTTIQAPANAVSKETNDTSVNTPISVPIATTAQASQQTTLETLLSDDFNGTACTTDDELDFLDSPSWQSYLSSGEQSEQYVGPSHAGYQSTSSVKSQSTPPVNPIYRPPPPVY